MRDRSALDDPDQSPPVPRQVDRLILDELQRGRSCLVLAPRRSGKTETLRRIAAALRQRGWRCVSLDFLGYGGGLCTIEDLLWDLTRSVSIQLGVPHEPAGRMQPRAFQRSSLRQSLLQIAGPSPCAPITLFLDEIEGLLTLQHPVLHQLTTSIRELAAQRSAADQPRIALVACTTSMRAAETWFPYGSAIVRFLLRDLSFREFCTALGRTDSTTPLSERWLQEAYAWVSGHPWLTQRLRSALCQVHEASVTPKPESLVSTLSRLDVNSLIHFSDLRVLIQRQPALMEEAAELYARILSGTPIQVCDAHPLHRELPLTGLVAQAEQGGRRVFRARNRLLADAFPMERLAQSILGSVSRGQ